ncbi:MAG: HAD-IIIC family phosphatase, partial [Candidatus Omnitrophota bacterium]
VSYFESMGGFIDSKLIKVKDTVIAVSHTAFQPSLWKSTWKEEILLDSSKESWVVDDSAMYGFKGVGRTILALAMRISYMENAEWFYIREPNDEILGLLDKLGFEPVESPETLGMLSEEMVYGFRLGQEVYPSIKISRLPVRSGWGLDTPFSSDGGRDRIREYASGNPSQQQIITELESLVNARNDDPDPLKHILYIEQGLLRLLYSSGLFTGRTIINIPAGLDILPAEFAPTYNLTYYAGAKLKMARDMAEDYLSGFGRYRDNLIYRDCDVRYINTYKHLGISGKKLLLSKGLSSFVQPFNRSDYIAGLDKEFLLSGDRILIMDQEDRLCFEGLFLDEGFYPVGDLFSGDIQERLDNLLRKINDSEITAWPYAGRNSLLIPTALVVLEKPAFKDGGVKRIYLLVHPLYSYELMLESEITEIFNGWKSFLELAGNDPDSIVVYIQENNECLYNQPLSECVDDLVNNLRKRVFYNSFPCDFELNMDKERELSIYACGDIFEGCLVELTEKLAWKLGLPKITAYLVYDMSIGYLGNAFPGIIRREKRLSAEMKARDYGLRIISYSDLAKEIGRVTEKEPAGDQGKDGGKLYKVYSALPFLFLALLPNAASAFVYFVFEDVFGPLALFPVLAVFLTLSLVYPFVILAISSVVAVIFGIGHSKLPGIFPGPYKYLGIETLLVILTAAVIIGSLPAGDTSYALSWALSIFTGFNLFSMFMLSWEGRETGRRQQQAIGELNSKCAWNRLQAAKYLKDKPDAAAMESLIRLLEDESYTVSSEAFNALVNAGKPAVQPLVIAFQNNASSARIRMLQAVAAIEGPQAITFLLRALNDNDRPVRAAALEELSMVISVEKDQNQNKDGGKGFDKARFETLAERMCKLYCRQGLLVGSDQEFKRLVSEELIPLLNGLRQMEVAEQNKRLNSSLKDEKTDQYVEDLAGIIRKELIVNDIRIDLSQNKHLSQDQVKWLHDNVIKPYARSRRRNGCEREKSDGGIYIGAQNMFHIDVGPFTGEISPSMLLREGVTYVILGHPERTAGSVGIQESYELVNKKIKAALKKNMTPVVCITDTMKEKKEGRSNAMLINRLSEALAGISGRQAQRIIIVYLPLWVLQQGHSKQKAMDPLAVQRICSFLRRWLAEDKGYGPKTAENIRLLYGRLVDSGNVADFVAQPDIDGVLVGEHSTPSASAAKIILGAEEYAVKNDRAPLVVLNLKLFEHGGCIIHYYDDLRAAISGVKKTKVVVCPTFLDIPYLSLFLSTPVAEKEGSAQENNNYLPDGGRADGGRLENNPEACRIVSKCLVVDCDGVLWKGIVGEDGIEGIQLAPEHILFQQVVQHLGESGVILAINSKNNVYDVEQVFWNRKDMVLRICDFSSHRVNWLAKDDNLRAIAAELNVGLDSLVFIDDSPREIELIRKSLPMVRALQFPADPVEIKQLIEELYGIFIKGTVTAEDKRRAEFYRARDSREQLKAAASSQEEYLNSLRLKVIIREGLENIPYAGRIAQLTQRTSQFNLTGKRFTEEQVKTLILSDKGYRVYSLQMADKFGDAGIVGVMIVSLSCGREAIKCGIEGFYLSCRAIGLTIENALMASVIKYLREDNIRIV